MPDKPRDRHCPKCSEPLKLSNGAFWCETVGCSNRGPVGFPETKPRIPKRKQWKVSIIDMETGRVLTWTQPVKVPCIECRTPTYSRIWAEPERRQTLALCHDCYFKSDELEEVGDAKP